MAAVRFQAAADAAYAYARRRVDPSIPQIVVRTLLNTYEGLYFLADPDIPLPDGVQVIECQLSPSRPLFHNNQYPLFDHAIRSLYLLGLIFSGNHLGFVANQNINDELSRDSFESLRIEGLRLLEVLGIRKEALFTALVLKKLCQAPRFREQFNADLDYYGDDLHLFWRRLLEYLKDNPPRVLSFWELSPLEREVVSQAAALAQFDRLFKGEYAAQLFQPLAAMPGLDPELLNFALFIARFDLAGEQPFNQEAYQIYEGVARACHRELIP